jgi:hypothetical protein
MTKLCTQSKIECLVSSLSDLKFKKRDKLASWHLACDGGVLQVNGQIPRGFVVLKPGHEETEENLTNFLESRLQVKN